MFGLKPKTFTGGELIRRIFNSLVKKNSYQLIDLLTEESCQDHGVLTIIANDSDSHRTRRGFMEYRQLALSSFGENIWAIGLGKTTGSYPSHPYCNDIIALKAGEDSFQNPESYFTNQIATKSGNFKNSLIHSASTYFVHDGSLRLVGPWKRFTDEGNPFGERILSYVEEDFQITEPRFGDRDNLLARLYPLDYSGEERTIYRKKDANKICDAIKRVLSE